jgi:hypothetical protein
MILCVERTSLDAKSGLDDDAPRGIAREDCEASMPLSYVENLQQPTRMAIDRVARETDLQVVDVRPYLCEGQTCATRRNDGFVLYADPAHISVPMSRELIPTFAEAINNAVR